MSISALGYCSFVVTERALFQARAYRQLFQDKNSAALFARQGSASAPLIGARVRGIPKHLSQMALMGHLEIPSIQLSAMVAEGDSAHVLQRAVGHVPGTAVPEQRGNVVLAGHRDTFFRGLGHLQKNDLIEFETVQGDYVYRVQSTKIVGPDETWVLNPSGGQTLTLITCYPFHFIGPAPKRFIVRATQVESDTRATHGG
jgi:sortase A